jgi:ribosomal protein S27AE
VSPRGSSLAVEESDEEEAVLKLRTPCPQCGADHLHRLEREGFLQKRIYPLFGYYPWRCSKCRGYFMLKKRSQPPNPAHYHHHRHDFEEEFGG